MSVIAINSPEEAIELFKASMDGDFNNFALEEITVGDWVNPHIYIPSGNSDITAPFLEALLSLQHSIYIIAAEVIHGEPDARKLTQEEIDKFQVRFQITGGSTNIVEILGDTLKSIATEAMGKLSAKQIIGLIAGGSILLSGTHGFTTYMEDRKEIRLAELKSEERIKEIDSARYALKDQVEATRFVAEKMAEQGGALARVAEESNKTNAALLRAIALTDDASVNGVRVTRAQAEVLRHNKRRRSDEKIIERLVKVVKIDTTDKAKTTVELSGAGVENVKVTFADRLIEDRDLSKLHRSLKERKAVRVKLEVRKVGDEIRSAEILRVTSPRNL